jgi:hypothetical protein
MTVEKWNIMGNTEEDDGYGRVIIPGQGPEMPADEDAERRPEEIIGDEQPETQIEPPPAKEEEPPPLSRKKVKKVIKEIIEHPPKQKLPN